MNLFTPKRFADAHVADLRQIDEKEIRRFRKEFTPASCDSNEAAKLGDSMRHAGVLTALS